MPDHPPPGEGPRPDAPWDRPPAESPAAAQPSAMGPDAEGPGAEGPGSEERPPPGRVVGLPARSDVPPNAPPGEPRSGGPPPDAPRARTARRRSPMEWAVLALLLLVAAGLAAYLAMRSEPAGALPELAEASAQLGAPADVLLDTDQPGVAEGFILDEFGQRVAVPALPEAALQGVGVAPVVPGTEVPVLLYERADGPVYVFVYSYALLDQTQDRLRLAAADYDGLVQPGFYALRRVGDQWTLLWRDRDDLFLAVAGTELDGLAAALFPGR